MSAGSLFPYAWEQRSLDAALARVSEEIRAEVAASVDRNHHEALQAWQRGYLPTVDPPASSAVFVAVIS